MRCLSSKQKCCTASSGFGIVVVVVGNLFFCFEALFIGKAGQGKDKHETAYGKGNKMEDLPRLGLRL